MTNGTLSLLSEQSASLATGALHAPDATPLPSAHCATPQASSNHGN